MLLAGWPARKARTVQVVQTRPRSVRILLMPSENQLDPGRPPRGGQAELDARLRSAYRACKRMQWRHDPTFYWATRRLPAEVRPAVHALYGFLRGADELVDGRGRAATPEGRRRALDAWQSELEHGLERGRS